MNEHLAWQQLQTMAQSEEATSAPPLSRTDTVHTPASYDYVLVFTRPSSKEAWNSIQERLHDEPRDDDWDELHKARIRHDYFKNCRERGLKLQFEAATSTTERQFFACHVTAR